MKGVGRRPENLKGSVKMGKVKDLTILDLE